MNITPSLLDTSVVMVTPVNKCDPPKIDSPNKKKKKAKREPLRSIANRKTAIVKKEKPPGKTAKRKLELKHQSVLNGLRASWISKSKSVPIATFAKWLVNDLEESKGMNDHEKIELAIRRNAEEKLSHCSDEDLIVLASI